MGKLGGLSARWAKAVTTCGSALLCAVLIGGTAVAAPAPPPSPAPASSGVPGQRDTVGLHGQLQELYRQAEQATERYNAATEQLQKQQTKVNDVRAGIVWAQQRVAELQEDMGRLARLQYTGQAIDPTLALLMTNDPAQFLRNAPTYAHIGQTAADTIARAKAAEKQLRGMQRSVDSELEESRRLEGEAEKAKTELLSRISTAEQILATLTPEELAALEALEWQAGENGQAQLVNAGILGRPNQLTTVAAQKAIAFALSKLGKPYIWGGTGPVGYDCSGLTLRAWEAAGVRIPRVSQDQWARLPKVPVSDMRPGDLIVYFADASHIAMYLGDGLMIHAPRPGRTITIAKAGSMPILGVVRPDGGAGTVTAPPVPHVPQPPTSTPRPPSTTNPPTTTDPGTGTPSTSVPPTNSQTPGGSSSPSTSQTPTDPATSTTPTQPSNTGTPDTAPSSSGPDPEPPASSSGGDSSGGDSSGGGSDAGTESAGTSE